MLKQSGAIVIAIVAFLLVGAVGFVLTTGALGNDGDANSSSPGQALTGEQRVMLFDLGMT